MRRFWSKFEQFTNIKYPAVIKRILKVCGIDRASFTDITEDTIEQIEKIVDKNKSILKDSVYEKIYIENTEFKLLFGHRLSLLNFSRKYIQFCEHEKAEKKSRKVRRLHLKIDDDDNTDDNITETSSDKIEPSHVKRLLLAKLNNTAQRKYQNKYTINGNQLKNLRIKGGEANCLVQCPFCDRKIPCTFKSYWIVSNFHKHISSHWSLKNASENSEREENRINPAQDTLNFRRGHNSVSEVVHKILGKVDPVNPGDKMTNDNII